MQCLLLVLIFVSILSETVLLVMSYLFIQLEEFVVAVDVGGIVLHPSLLI